MIADNLNLIWNTVNFTHYKAKCVVIVLNC